MVLTSASLHVDKVEGLTPVGKLTTRGKELNVYDKTFEMNYVILKIALVSFSVTR